MQNKKYICCLPSGVQVIIFLIKSVPLDHFPNLANDTSIHQPLKTEGTLLWHNHPLAKESILQTDVNTFFL